jgi:hypothetical protein
MVAEVIAVSIVIILNINTIKNLMKKKEEIKDTGKDANDMVFETQIELIKGSLFDVMCYDGFAVASDGKQTLLLSYPKFKELTGEDITSVAEHRGLPTREIIHYGDIMLTYKTITRNIQS